MQSVTDSRATETLSTIDAAATVLIVDDEASVCESLSEVLGDRKSVV